MLLRSKESGSVMVEGAIGIALFVAVSYAALSTIAVSMSASNQALYSALVDNYLENQAALISAASMNADGSINLSALAGTITYGTNEQTRTNIALLPNGGTGIAATNGYVIDVSTIAENVGSIGSGSGEGQTMWQYSISAMYDRFMPDGSTQTYRKSRTVLKTQNL